MDFSSLGVPVLDADEESFTLFSHDFPPQNLGFVTPDSSTLTIPIHSLDYSIRQSPSLLNSSRAGGTTGAVLWRITPVLAAWLSDARNPLREMSVVNPGAEVVELGCGISAVLALALGPLVGRYLATDQGYVGRGFGANVRENLDVAYRQRRREGGKAKAKGKEKGKGKGDEDDGQTENITFSPLDWETDDPSRLKDCIAPGSEDKGFDLLVSCDCIYNDALVSPFVRTCADICRLRPSSNPTVCIIAQQLRAPDVLDEWLRTTMNEFHVWRVSDDVLSDGLKLGSGYVVHLLVLREDRL